MERKTEIELTNMCLVYNDDAVWFRKRQVQNIGGGLVFPGGHVEEGESLRGFDDKGNQGRDRSHNFRLATMWF